MSNLLILGAGVCQLPLIRAAKERGFHTIVMSIPGRYPGLSAADEAVLLNACDASAVLSVAKEKSVSGIVSTALESALPAMAEVCETLGLHGAPVSAATFSCDKVRMKLAFQKYGVPTAAFRVAYTNEEALQAAEELGWPVIVKTRAGSGSRGVKKAHNRQELNQIMQQFPLPEGLLLEAFVSGCKEIGADGLVQNGQVKCLLLHEKMTFHNGHVDVPVGHIFPYEAEENLKKRAESAVLAAVKAMEMNDCAFNVDLFVSDEQVFIIEATARCGATGIPEAASIYLGQSWFDALIDLSIGKEIQPMIGNGCASASLLMMSDCDGQAKGLLPCLDQDIIRIPDGDFPYPVRRFVTCADRAGLLLVQKPNREMLLQTLKELVPQRQLLVCSAKEERQ